MLVGRINRPEDIPEIALTTETSSVSFASIDEREGERVARLAATLENVMPDAGDLPVHLFAEPLSSSEAEPPGDPAPALAPSAVAPSAYSERMDLCEHRIDYVFRNRELLQSALTHASGAEHRLASNERLEFLGDAILGAVVCELLFHQFPDYLEGDLTKIKSVVVSRQTCAKISEALGLQQCLILGKGMASSPDVPPSLLADVFESLVAAIYLDGGDAAAREFIVEYIGPEIELVAAGELGGNYKSLLQQYAQRECGSTPSYHLLDEKGPDHSKAFKITAQVQGKRYSPAWGRNKKEAEQRAASNALSELHGEAPPYSSD